MLRIFGMNSLGANCQLGLLPATNTARCILERRCSGRRAMMCAIVSTNLWSDTSKAMSNDHKFISFELIHDVFYDCRLISSGPMVGNIYVCCVRIFNDFHASLLRCRKFNVRRHRIALKSVLRIGEVQYIDNPK